MVRLNNNDSQNLVLRGNSNAGSHLANNRAHNSQRNSAVVARSRVASAARTNRIAERQNSASISSNQLAQEAGTAVVNSPKSNTKSVQLERIEDTIQEHLELSKSMKKYYQGKIDTLTAQGDVSSAFERGMLDNHRKELSLYQSAEDFWLTERNTSYQYDEQDLVQVESFYEEIKTLQTRYDETGETQNQISTKIRELYNLKQGVNPFGDDAEFNPADKQADMLQRMSAATSSATEAGAQVDKWLAYSIENPDASSPALANARNQESFSKTSQDIWKNRFNFWNEVAEQSHFINDKERLDEIEVLTARISKAEDVLAHWLGSTEDIDQARGKAAEALAVIGDLEVQVRKLFI